MVVYYAYVWIYMHKAQMVDLAKCAHTCIVDPQLPLKYQAHV